MLSVNGDSFAINQLLFVDDKAIVSNSLGGEVCKLVSEFGGIVVYRTDC